MVLELGLWTEASAAQLRSASQGKIILLVSVDWEGRSLSRPGLTQMREFREEFPDLGLLHFLNAAYFTKANANADQLAIEISSVLRSQDELGLHIHGWKSLFEAAGVNFRSTPTFWGNRIDCRADCGHDVPISSYTTEELRRVIRYSVNTLQQAGFGRATSFRAGGWMASQNVLDALSAEGFLLDSSSVPAEFLASEIGETDLYRWVAQLWKGTTPLSQPHYLNTATSRILEMPDNGALADYMKASEMVQVYKTAAAKWKAHPDQDIWVHIGFHQETASTYLSRVAQAVREIKSYSEQNGLPLTYAQLPLHF